METEFWRKRNCGPKSSGSGHWMCWHVVAPGLGLGVPCPMGSESWSPSQLGDPWPWELWGPQGLLGNPVMPLYPVTRDQGRQQWCPGPVVCAHLTAGSGTAVRTEMSSRPGVNREHTAASGAGRGGVHSSQPRGRCTWTIQVCKGKFLQDLCGGGGEAQSAVVALALVSNARVPCVAGLWGGGGEHCRALHSKNCWDPQSWGSQ